MIFGEIDSFISLWDRLRKIVGRRKSMPSAETVAERFIRLFESHGVHRNQIPRFFGHDLTLADVKDGDTLLPRLTDEMLNAACDMFSVRREWLDGAESQVYPRHIFYKHPELFLDFIEDLNSANPDSNLHGIVVRPVEWSRNVDTLLILEETIGHIGDKPIYRYHFCDNWSYSYWKSRAYLTACVATAWKHGSHVRGIVSTRREIEPFISGDALLNWEGGGFSEPRHKRWYPEDMALQPNVYLDGVDSESGGFGLRAALSHWLMLDDSGYMDTGINGGHRQAFQYELDKLSSNLSL